MDKRVDGLERFCYGLAIDNGGLYSYKSNPTGDMPMRHTPATKTEVFLLDGVEITRARANHIAYEHASRIQGATIMSIVAFRDLGTLESPSIAAQGKLWREFRAVKVSRSSSYSDLGK